MKPRNRRASFGWWWRFNRTPHTDRPRRSQGRKAGGARRAGGWMSEIRLRTRKWPQQKTFKQNTQEEEEAELRNKNPPTPCLWEAPASTAPAEENFRRLSELFYGGCIWGKLRVRLRLVADDIYWTAQPCSQQAWQQATSPATFLEIGSNLVVSSACCRNTPTRQTLGGGPDAPRYPSFSSGCVTAPRLLLLLCVRSWLRREDHSTATASAWV